MSRDERMFAVLVDGESQTTLIVEQRGAQMGIVFKGERGGLWVEMVWAYEEWLAQGKPGRECFVLVMTPEGQEMRVVQLGISRMLTIVG